jgi:hypothetical protein
MRGLFARFSKLPDFDFQAFSTVFTPVAFPCLLPVVGDQTVSLCGHLCRFCRSSIAWIKMGQEEAVAAN